MRVALYARCSTKKQDLDSQVGALTEWVRYGQHAQVGLYQDFAASGKKDDRSGILSLMAAARRREFDLVGVVELSRLGRSIGFIHGCVEELHKLGIRLVLVKNNTVLDYGSLEGRALLGGLALAADIEWMLIQERNERGRAKIKEDGIKVGRKHSEVSLNAIIALKAQGMSLREISAEMGVSPATIMRRLQTVPKLGISDAFQETGSGGLNG